MEVGNKSLYIFLDESGNFDFSHKGTKFYVLTCITKIRPFLLCGELESLKYNLIEYGVDLDYFHASENKKPIRERVYNIINNSKADFRIDSIVIEKRKTHPKLQDESRFYPEMMGYLLKYVLRVISINSFKEVIIITDSIPKTKKNAANKTLKLTLSQMLPQHVKYRVMHHNSEAHYGLQLVDYCNYAIYRKWETGFMEYYDIIKGRIKSEFNIFETGSSYFY